jgi:WD40 repeat protein/DNA-binding SARP family transcriptional activator
VGIEVLGPAAIDGTDGLTLRDRVVLQALVVRAGEIVDKQVLADALWGDDLPASWSKVVQGCIARLRKLLPRDAITTTPQGYRLTIHEDELDARRFERMLARAREHLVDRDPDRASYVLSEALALWRGRALSDLDEWEPGRAESERLDGLRMDAHELRVEAEIAAGRSRTVLEDARALVKEAPFRERRWALFAQALYQAGRQTEALDVLNRARRMLRDELGLDPGAELVALEQAILRQDPGLAGAEAVQTSLVCPYRGLLPYEAVDAESFFGRDADVVACLERLRSQGILAVVGPSGIGKSSLVRAGVTAALERDGTRVLVTTPGTRPVDSLAGLPAKGTLTVLVVDQAEEAVTLCTDPAERAAYFERLGGYGGPMVIAIRTDRLDDLSMNPQMARLVESGLYLLAAMSEENLRAAIEGPARHAGLRLEPGLVDLLVREVEGEPGALPLLSHVLRQTWELREGPTLTVDGYRATGGIRNAVAQSAESLYERLDDRQRVQLRDLFLRLVMPSGDGDAVRARVPRKKLAMDAAHEQLVNTLVDARLVSSDQGDVQIAHEALAREWPRLRGWLEEDIEGQRIFRHLAAAAESWDTMGRPESELYRGIRLAAASDWAGRSTVDLTETERAFLDASADSAERERNAAQAQLRAQARSNRHLRLSLGGVAVFLVAALVAGTLAITAAHHSDLLAREAARAARIADSRRLAAQALTTTEPDVALLLAVEAARLDSSLATTSSLYSVLQGNSHLVGVARESGSFNSVDISPDGTTVAVASPGGPDGGRLLTFEAGTLQKTADRDDLPVGSLEYSPDGKHLVVASSAFEGAPGEIQPPPEPLRILDAASLDPIGTFGGVRRNSWIDRSIDFSGNGKRLVAVAWKDHQAFEALVWDVARPARPILRVPLQRPGIYDAAELSPDGNVLYLAMAAPQILHAIDVRTGKVLARDEPRYGGERGPVVALSQDGSTIATSDLDGIAVRSSDDLAVRFMLAGQSAGTSALAFTPDGNRLAAGYADGATVVWDLESRKPEDTFRGHSQEVYAHTFSPDGGSLYSVGLDGQLLAFDLTGNRGFPPWRRYPDNPQLDNLSAALPSPDGKTVAYTGYGRSPEYHWQVQFRDVESGRLTERRYFPRGPGAMTTWTPDSQSFLAAAGYTDDDPHPPDVRPSRLLQVWDPSSGTVVRTWRDTDIATVAFTADGERMFSLSVSVPVKLRVHDPVTLAPVGEPIVLGPPQDFWPLETTPDGNILVMFHGNTSRTYQVADLRAGTVATRTFYSAAGALSLSPDGARAVFLDGNGRWGVVSLPGFLKGELKWVVPLRQFKANYPWHITWSADGTQLFTSGNGVVDLWDARTMSHIGSLSVGGKDDVATVLPLEDGHTVLIARPQGDVLTWDLRPQHLLDLACDLAGRNLTPEEWASYLGERPYRQTCPNEGTR